MELAEEFNRKLINIKNGNRFLFIDPPEEWKPDFIVDAKAYLEWFKNKFEIEVPAKGYLISFIQGSPGAGKTHFIRYLDYLFNVSGNIIGLYGTYPAGKSKISSRDLWLSFLSKSNVFNKVSNILNERIVNESSISDLRVKRNLISYSKNTLELENLKDDDLQALVAGIKASPFKDEHWTLLCY